MGVGSKSTNRGVLILFATDDHRDRIEVGYGLGPILTDGKVGGFECAKSCPTSGRAITTQRWLLVTRRVADVIAADRGVTLTGAAAVPPPDSDDGQGGSSAGHFVSLLFLIFIVFMLFRRGGAWSLPPWLNAGFGNGHAEDGEAEVLEEAAEAEGEDSAVLAAACPEAEGRAAAGDRFPVLSRLEFCGEGD